MKPETQERLKKSVASLLAAAFESAWAWKRLPSEFVRKNRVRIQRAARKAKAEDNPVGFVEHYLGSDFFALDAKLPEGAAIALSDVFTRIAQMVHDEQRIFELVSDKTAEREIAHLLGSFFRSLAARPGRPQKDKYRSAAAFCVQKGKTSNHRLCLLFDPAYRSLTTPEQRRRAQDRMRSGVNRVLKAAANRTKLPA